MQTRVQLQHSEETFQRLLYNNEMTADTRVLMGGRWKEECFLETLELTAFPYPQSGFGQ